MQIYGNLVAKDGTSLNDGEFVVFNQDRARLCGIALSDEEGPFVLVVHSDDPATFEPHVVATRNVFSCLSFGKNAILEPVFGPETAAARVARQPGALVAHGDDLFVALSDGHGSDATTAINIKTGAKNPAVLVKGAWFCKWRVWHSEQDMMRTGAKPIAEIDVTPRQKG